MKRPPEMARTVKDHGRVSREALIDQIALAETDLLLAEDQQDILRVADHLRLLASQVESFAERMPV